MHSNFNDLKTKTMTARDFLHQRKKYGVFSKLTSTGISDDLDKITEFAEDYHQAKLKLLGIPNAVKQRELLIAFMESLNREHITDIEIGNFDKVADRFLGN